MSAGVRAVGVDVGGTFTDLVWTDGVDLRTLKVPSTRSQEEGFLRGLEALSTVGLDRLVHGSTVATNALLEGAWAETALLVTDGTRDVLEIGRQARPALYDLQAVPPAPIVPRTLRFEIPERLDARGRVVRPLDEPAVRAVARALPASVRSVAVALLFSFLDGHHERRVAELLRAEGVELPITLSCEVLPEVREYERTSTTVVSAALRPVVAGYLERLCAGLAARGGNCPLLLMDSAGGVLSPADACRRAAGLLLSGPAAGVQGARTVAAAAGISDAITLDMGGTSTDVGLVLEGQAQLSSAQLIAGRPVRLPMVDVHTIGAGGGSIAWVDAGGALRVGPRSAGASPGPACYGSGGAEATVTDAQLILGRLPADRPLGGLEALSRARAERALAKVAAQLDMPVPATAWGVLEIAEAAMERAVRIISVERGHDPRGLALVAFGGAGPLHGVSLARKLGIARVLVPAHAGVLSALGLTAADLVCTFVRSLVTSWSRLSPKLLAGVWDEFEREAHARLAAAGVAHRGIRAQAAADVRYQGQGHELTVACSTPVITHADIALLAERFHAAHEAAYGFATPEAPLELVSLRLTARGLVAKAPLPEAPRIASGDLLVERRSVHFGPDFALETPVFRRTALPAGRTLEGPCVVEGEESTCLLPPGSRAEVDAIGNLLVEVGTWTR